MPSERLLEAVKQYITKVGGMQAFAARRYKAQTDLWFLSTEIFRRDFVERTHRPVIDFFLKKIPFKPAFEPGCNYSLGQFHAAIAALAPLEGRKGELLYPRGTYKSSADADDICQYIVCYPDIRILVLVGESSLGEAFVPEIKRRFILEPNREPSEFQLLFNEFVIETGVDKDKGGEQEYWCPARKIDQKEPTLGSLSLLGSTSGWHMDVMKADDVITDTTPVATSASRNKIVRKFVNVMNLLEAHSVMELIGTRYHLEDLYDHIKKALPLCRYLCGASWTALPHMLHKKPEELTSNDVVLLFPEVQTFAVLKEKLNLDPDTFYCQQLNDPAKGGAIIRFKLEDLRAATLRVPQDDSFARYNFWDVATTASEGSDYSVGVFISIDTTQWIAYVHHVVCDKFTPSELAYQIAKLGKETLPRMVMFEKYVATEQVWLEQEVKRVAVGMGYDIPVKAEKTDKSKKAKGNRIAGLEPLIRGKRLFFSNLIPSYVMELLYKQFTDFTGEPSQKKHDDIPDAISFLRRVLPMTGLEMPQARTEAPLMDNSRENAAWLAARTKDAAQKAFLLGTMPPAQQPMAAPRPDNDTGNPYFPTS